MLLTHYSDRITLKTGHTQLYIFYKHLFEREKHENAYVKILLQKNPQIKCHQIFWYELSFKESKL